MVKVLLMIFIPMIILIVLLAVFTMIIDKYVTKKALNSSKLYFEKGFNEEYNKHGDTEKFSLFLIKLDKFSYYISFKDEKQNLTSLKEKRDRGEFESDELSSINKFIRCDLKSVLKIKASEVAEYKMSFFMAKPYIKKMLE